MSRKKWVIVKSHYFFTKIEWLSFGPSNREQMFIQQTDSQYLSRTAIIDSGHPLLAAHAEKTVNDSNDPVGKHSYGVWIYQTGSFLQI